MKALDHLPQDRAGYNRSLGSEVALISLICVPSLLIYNRQGSSAISLLSELLKLDWRKRINAIDAKNHPYFKNHPLPARPGDIPAFEDSHELDRRNARGQKPALPPAPAGGTVGLDFNEDWTNQPYVDVSGLENDTRIQNGRSRPQNNRYADSNNSSRRYDNSGPPLHDRKNRNNSYQNHVPHRPAWSGSSKRYYNGYSSEAMHYTSTHDHPKEANRYKPPYPSNSRDFHTSSVRVLLIAFDVSSSCKKLTLWFSTEDHRSRKLFAD